MLAEITFCHHHRFAQCRHLILMVRFEAFFHTLLEKLMTLIIVGTTINIPLYTYIGIFNDYLEHDELIISEFHFEFYFCSSVFVIA